MVQIISFPRSGQNLINTLFEKIFSSFDISYTYCSYYQCCKTVPCLHGKIFQKNHDFDLQLPINPREKYILLYRNNTIFQLEAFYRYHCKQNELNTSLEGLVDFYYKRIDYYNNFIKKWVKSSHPNVFVIEYYHFCENPFPIMKNCLNFLYPSFVFDYNKLNQILNEEHEVKHGSKLGLVSKRKIGVEHYIDMETYQKIVKAINMKNKNKNQNDSRK